MAHSENDAPAEGALVARSAAAPATVMVARDAFADANVHRATTKASVETLTASLDALRISKPPAPPAPAATITGAATTATVAGAAAQRRSDAASISPADFVNLQSMRSSALARKTNTTSKFSRDCRNLFADLLTPSATAGELDDHKDPKDPKDSKDSKKDPKDAKKGPKDSKKDSKEDNKVETSAETDPEDKTSEKKDPKDKAEDGDKTPTPSAAEEKAGPAQEQDGAAKKDQEAENDVEDENELLSRGPVRASRAPNAYHPYAQADGGDASPYASASGAMYGTAAQSTVYDPTSFSSNVYSYGYDCGATQYGSSAYQQNSNCAGVYHNAGYGVGALDSRESTPDTIHSDLGYGSAYSPPVGIPPRIAGGMTPNFGVDPAKPKPKSNTVEEEQELPDALSDFILQYSRQYASNSGPTTMAGMAAAGGSQGASPAQSSAAISSTFTSAESSPLAHYGHDFDFFSAPNSNKCTMPADASDSQCASPLSAISAPKCSPAQPHGAWAAGGVPPTTSRVTAAAPAPPVGRARPAKDRLRALINNDDMDEAWAWTCKCIQNYPGALCYQDADRDTLLHIVALHADHAKIYALVEQILKMESEFSGGEVAAQRGQKPFDMANRAGETPLFLAVEKRDVAVVEYLLEAGAQPNAQSLRANRDTPLHYAAARGMTQIVEALCSHPRIDVNLANGAGLTPLLYAVKHHGVLDDDDLSGAGNTIDNVGVVRTLLRDGADANITDSINGKTVFHYAVERLSEELITTLHAQLGDVTTAQLVNRADHSGETPLRRLRKDEAAARSAADGGEPTTRSRLCMALISCGADSTTD